MTVASRAVMMAVMTEARAVDVEQEGHWGMHVIGSTWISSFLLPAYKLHVITELAVSRCSPKGSANGVQDFDMILGFQVMFSNFEF